MLKGNLPESNLVGNMIQTLTPNGQKIFYPALLAQSAMSKGQYSVFHSMDDTGFAHLVITQPDKIRFRLGGNPMKIIDAYENIPWDEQEIHDKNGVFYYKVAPSLQELNEYFDSNKHIAED